MAVNAIYPEKLAKLEDSVSGFSMFAVLSWLKTLRVILYGPRAVDKGIDQTRLATVRSPENLHLARLGSWRVGNLLPN